MFIVPTLVPRFEPNDSSIIRFITRRLRLPNPERLLVTALKAKESYTMRSAAPVEKEKRKPLRGNSSFQRLASTSVSAVASDDRAIWSLGSRQGRARRVYWTMIVRFIINRHRSSIEDDLSCRAIQQPSSLGSCCATIDSHFGIDSQWRSQSLVRPISRSSQYRTEGLSARP